MKPHKKQDAPEPKELGTTVAGENERSKTNEQEEDGGAYARPRALGENEELLDRPNRGA